jgi:hypothetical protein
MIAAVDRKVSDNRYLVSCRQVETEARKVG